MTHHEGPVIRNYDLFVASLNHRLNQWYICWYFEAFRRRLDVDVIGNNQVIPTPRYVLLSETTTTPPQLPWDTKQNWHRKSPNHSCAGADRQKRNPGKIMKKKMKRKKTKMAFLVNTEKWIKWTNEIISLNIMRLLLIGAHKLSLFMMTSSNGNIFRVTDPLYAEFTGHRWTHRSKASDAEPWCFYDLRPNKRLSKQSWGWWFEMPSWPLWRHNNVIDNSDIAFNNV